MKKSRFLESQISAIPRQAPVTDDWNAVSS